MRNLKRTILKVSVAVMLIINTGIEIYAGEIDLGYADRGYEIEYYYPNQDFTEDEVNSYHLQRNTLIKQTESGLTIENRVAYIYGRCESYDPADIQISVTLQRYDNGNWKDIKTFSASESNKKSVYVDDSYLVTRNYEYRLVVVGTVDTGSTSETVTKYSSSKVCYNEVDEQVE